MKSKTTTEPWAKAQPYILGGADAVQNAYGANSDAIQSATNSVTGLLPSMIAKYQQGNPAVNAATSYNTDVLSGRYLGGNPELENVVNRSVNDATNATQAALGLRGLTGGSSYADIISRNAGNTASDLRYGDYNNERARMATAAGQAPGLSAADVIQIAPMLSTLDASQTPLRAAGGYAGSLGGLLGQYNTTTQSQGIGGLLAQLAGSGLSAWASGGIGG